MYCFCGLQINKSRTVITRNDIYVKIVYIIVSRPQSSSNTRVHHISFCNHTFKVINVFSNLLLVCNGNGNKETRPYEKDLL